MTHASPTEIHDHVYGFAPSPHVVACDECRALAGRVDAEREALRRAMAIEPARRRSAMIPLAALAAAALLAALAWLLFHEPSNPDPQPARAQEKDAVDRRIGELRSPSKERREVAARALRAYGEAAIEKIRAAKFDPELFKGYRIAMDDPQLRKRSETLKLDMSFESTKLEDMLPFIQDFAGVKIVIDPPDLGRIDRDKAISFKVKDLSLHNSLRLLLAQFGMNPFYEDGRVLLSSDQPPAAARAAVRIGQESRTAPALVRALGAGPAEDRDKASAALRRQGFAAERALWEAVDSPDKEVQSRALDLLYNLYTPRATPTETLAVRKRLADTRIAIDMQNAPLRAVINYLSEVSGLNIVLDSKLGRNEVQKPVSIRGTDLPLDSMLTLTMDLQHAGHWVENGVVVAGFRSPSPPPLEIAIWATPAEAARIEALIANLASPERDRQDRAARELTALEERALLPLLHGSQLLEGPAAERCRTLRDRIAQKLAPGVWPEPFGSDVQTRTEAQKQLLERKLDVAAEGHTLGEILRKEGIRCDIRSAGERKHTLAIREARLVAVLKALTRPYGLDFHFDGETVVIDTAASVRLAVDK